VEQRDWKRPSRAEWTEQIGQDVERAGEPVILVAHSLGCLAVAHWAAVSRQTHRVAGAFLVAPPWLAHDDPSPRELAGFLPMPILRLPFPSLFVASENDPYLPLETGEGLASAWGSEVVNVGRRGHINVASGHGPWSHGEQLLSDFVGKDCFNVFPEFALLPSPSAPRLQRRTTNRTGEGICPHVRFATIRANDA
jgi:hypothetical protein